MLQYKKIDVSEGIDTDKTRATKESMLPHYRYFKDDLNLNHIFVINVTMY